MPGFAAGDDVLRMMAGRIQANARVLDGALRRLAVQSRHANEAITFARSRGMPFALRGGGHSFAGHSSTRGLLIDLGELTSIAVGAGTVTVGPGVLVAGLARRLAGHDRVVPCGWCPTVGVTGAVLGGVALRGGEGLVLGVVLGTALMQVLQNTINLVGDSNQLEFAVVGGVILAGAAVDEALRRWWKRRR